MKYEFQNVLICFRKMNDANERQMGEFGAGTAALKLRC